MWEGKEDEVVFSRERIGRRWKVIYLERKRRLDIHMEQKGRKRYEGYIFRKERMGRFNEAIEEKGRRRY